MSCFPPLCINYAKIRIGVLKDKKLEHATKLILESYIYLFSVTARGRKLASSTLVKH